MRPRSVDTSGAASTSARRIDGLLHVALPGLAAHHGVRMRGVPGEDAPSPGVTTRE
ncbi:MULTISPECIES: hypothetical protein [Streptomyces]|uniref:hypothetical protein n=1 Tax=Streptomyces TaxID=1883 RepID=UPI001F20FC32|nr:hypothetical protein [Streptomyces indiaensis]MCF1646596.1 hypothetical protein [Streptomyces indiaensis]